MSGEARGVDTDATSFLVVAVGTDVRTREVAGGWVRRAESIAPTRLLVLDSLTLDVDRAALVEALAALRVGCRIHLCGGRYDVLQARALAHECGAIPAEVVVEMTGAEDLPVYCAHCRATHRMVVSPGGTGECPGCGLRLEVHEHSSTVLGSYLASATGDEELVA